MRVSDIIPQKPALLGPGELFNFIPTGRNRQTLFVDKNARPFADHIAPTPGKAGQGGASLEAQGGASAGGGRGRRKDARECAPGTCITSLARDTARILRASQPML